MHLALHHHSLIQIWRLMPPKYRQKPPNKNVNIDLKQRDVPSIYSLLFDYLIVMISYSLESRFQEPSSARAIDLMLTRNCLL